MMMINIPQDYVSNIIYWIRINMEYIIKLKHFKELIIHIRLQEVS